MTADEQLPLLRIAFPDGMRVSIGPSHVLGGVVDWRCEGRLPASRFERETTMLECYPDAVPVRAHGIMGGVTFHCWHWLKAI